MPPFLKITTDDVGAVFKRRRRRAVTQPGPFLIISVESGLALDTALNHDAGTHPNLWTVHGLPHQLWRLIPSGYDGEVRIASYSNNLFLDGHGSRNGDHPQMREGVDEPRQRWRLTPSPNGRAHYLENAATGLVLDRPSEGECGSRPQVWRKHSGKNQQWLVVMSFSPLPDS